MANRVPRMADGGEAASAFDRNALYVRPGAHVYDTPLQVLAALLAIGFVLTLLVRPLKRNTE